MTGSATSADLLGRAKVFCLLFSILIAASMVVILLLPKRYRAGFTVLCPHSSPWSMVDELSSGALSAPGLGANAEDAFLSTLVGSERFREEVARKRFTVWFEGRSQSLSLAQLAGVESGVSFMADYLHVVRNKMDGSVRVAVETPIPELSYRAAQYVLDRLQARLEEQRISLMSEARRNYRTRIDQARASLLTVEGELGSYLARNRNWARSDHPGERLELDRLRRKQEVYEAIYIDALKNAYLAELAAYQSVPPLLVLDPPSLPAIKSFPPRRKLGLLALFAAGAASVLIVAGAEVVGRAASARVRACPTEGE